MKTHYDSGLQGLDYRPLVTETLPYEVPITFSNDKIFAFLSSPSGIGAASPELKRLLDIQRNYTLPYSYNIRKSPSSQTTLSIIHPLDQIRVCAFYKYYAPAILYHTATSEFTLRAPREVVDYFSTLTSSPKVNSAKTGEANNAEENADESDNHIKSYFAVGRYNLLSKFFKSKEFIRYETKFLHLRQIDVSKCFAHIYTHSISWAVKDKETAKANTTNVSFEASFDKLMQTMNYNETNGIVIGPEFSRVFAEIILQDADEKIRRRMIEKGKSYNRDYVVRRYIDDYFIFANSESVLDDAERAIEQTLEGYKLYVNRSKRIQMRRPFVTNILVARRKIDEILDGLHGSLSSESKVSLIASLEAFNKVARRCIFSFREVVASSDVEFNNFSAELLSRLGATTRRISYSAGSDLSEDQSGRIARSFSEIIEAMLYVCSLDLRVRTTYIFCQFLGEALPYIRDALTQNDAADVWHVAHSGLVGLAKSAFLEFERDDHSDKLELYNILLIGALELGSDFSCNADIVAICKEIQLSSLTYFKFIVLKTVFLQDRARFSVELSALNQKVAAKIASDGSNGLRKSEQYLLFCDFISSPDLSDGERVKCFKSVFGGNPSKKGMAEIAASVSFTDWTGAHVMHLLKRKRLNAVYSSA